MFQGGYSSRITAAAIAAPIPLERKLLFSPLLPIGDGVYRGKVMEQFESYFCKINIRLEYEGSKAKPKSLLLNGEILKMKVMWYMGKEDRYPGEYALIPEDKTVWNDWNRNYDTLWIASGDVEFMEENK